MLPDGTANGETAGKLSKMRFHSGFVPNVFGIGVRRKLTETTTIKAQLSIWGTIETQAQRKFVPVITDFREGFLEADGPWGTFTAGRFGSLPVLWVLLGPGFPGKCRSSRPCCRRQVLLCCESVREAFPVIKGLATPRLPEQIPDPTDTGTGEQTQSSPAASPANFTPLSTQKI